MEPKRGRGRPATVDANALARVALGLFLKRGFDQVTMADIAAAAGIGRRTVFRYFPSKYALVWGGAEDVNTEVARVLPEEDRPGRSTGEVIAAAYRRAYRSLSPELRALARDRVRIIHDYPDVYAYGHARWLEDHGVLAGLIARREQLDADDLVVALRAQLVGALTFTAFVWWAEQPEADFFDTTDRALAELERVLSS